MHLLMEEESSGQACFCIIVQRPGNFLLDIVIFVFPLQWEKKRRRMCLSFSYEQDIFHLDPQEIKYCC